MKKLKIVITLLMLIMLSSDYVQVFAKSPTLYVVSRSTKKFKIGSQEFPTVGLFSTTNQGKSWKHYGWNYVKSFSMSPIKIGKENTFYLSAGNGVQKSEDGGKTWIITTNSKITECLKTAIDPVKPEIVYSAGAYGIFKTTDGGKNWEEKNTGLVSTFTPTVIIDKSNHKHLFCATERGVHRSLNQAEKWEPIGLLGLGVRTLIQFSSNPDILAAGTEEDGIFISTDHGKNWHQKNDGLTTKTIYALAFAPQNSDIIYAGTFQGGIFKSTDGGESWKAINKNLRVLDIHAMIVDPERENIVYAGTLNDGVWISEDAGENWRFIGLETSQIWDMVFF